MTHRRRRINRAYAAAALAGALIAAAPAAAGAAELAPLKACYVSAASGETETVIVSGTRFAPAVVVDIMIDGVPRASAVTDLNGKLPPTGVPAPLQRVGQRAFAVVVQQRANPGDRAETTALVTDLQLSILPQSAAPSERLRWTGVGFTAQAPVYAHYVYRGRSRRTIVLAQPTGPCGSFQVRRRQFPFRPRPGRWTVQVDQVPAYRKRPDSVNFRLRISVRRRDRSAGPVFPPLRPPPAPARPPRASR